MDIDSVLAAYIASALWTSVDDDDKPMDSEYDATDLADETVTQMREDVESFLNSVEEAGWDVSKWTDSQMGHDFWLTRNGHGAGFWDRGHGQIGTDLTDLAKPYGEFCLYVGDDGSIYGA
jgi:hypothetical protein